MILRGDARVHPDDKISKPVKNRNSATHDLSCVGICSTELHNRLSVIPNGMEFIGVQIEPFRLWRGGLSAPGWVFGLHPTPTSRALLRKLNRVICLSSFISKLP